VRSVHVHQRRLRRCWDALRLVRAAPVARVLAVLALSGGIGGAALAGCAFGRAPEGNPSRTDAAQARLVSAQKDAAHVAVVRAVTFAREHSDERATKKALALVRAQPDVLGDQSARAFAISAGAACTTWPDAADALHAGHLDNDALAVETRALDSCKDARAGIAAADTYRHMQRCTDGVAIARRAYPFADVGVRVDVLDAIARCSDATDLETNLKTVITGDALHGYLADRSARICESRCSDARSECDVSCGQWSECFSRCSALEHACAAGCR
jgi:hypothetical protein